MWARAEACSGRRGNFERIRWWVVPGVETFEYGTEQPYADGLWDSDGDITLAGGVLSHPDGGAARDAARVGLRRRSPRGPLSGPPAARPGDRGTRPKRSSSCRLTLPPTLPEPASRSVARLLHLHDPDITMLGRGRVHDSVAVDPPSATRWPGSLTVKREEQMRSFPIQGDLPERGIPSWLVLRVRIDRPSGLHSG